MKPTALTLPCLAALLGLFACSGDVASVTTLPSSDPVATNGVQFCSDATSYIDRLEPQIVPLACEAAAMDVPASQCQSEYSVCLAEVPALLKSDAGSALSQSVLSGCANSLGKCSATVGQLSQCISDYGNALTAASSGITAQSACAHAGSGSSDPLDAIAEPASCASLPPDCLSSSSSSSASPSHDAGAIPFQGDGG